MDMQDNKVADIGKNLEASLDKREKLVQEIISKALNDAEFKNDLLKDAKEALKKEFNIIIPDNVEVAAVEETPSKVYLVIPNQNKQIAENPHW